MFVHLCEFCVGFVPLLFCRHSCLAGSSDRVFQTGDFRTLQAAGMIYAYARSDSAETFVVALNAGRDPATAEIDLASWGGGVSATYLA